MIDRWTLTLEVGIRPCREDDLARLEWFGHYAEHRQIFRQAFARQARGEVVMLVAEANGFPVGQVWIDLVKQRDEAVAVLWALRVLPCLQNLGIGRRLIAAAEHLARERGFAVAELGVEHDNIHARRLYERLGYVVVGDNVEAWDYTTPDGRQVHVVAPEWIMRRRLI